MSGNESPNIEVNLYEKRRDVAVQGGYSGSAFNKSWPFLERSKITQGSLEVVDAYLTGQSEVYTLVDAGFVRSYTGFIHRHQFLLLEHYRELSMV